ncbi:MAG: DUF1501 domain-containing protein [Planctomycetales bacterium]|nr:DUF1501 domain-containing protein [Planctomycetales bacterium]
MAGGPSQVDTFDPKPELAKLDGKDVPDSIARHVPKIQRAGLKNLLASPWKFSRHGESGMPISALFPELSRHADELCVIRSMSHRNPVHGPGECLALCGAALGNRPSLGAWTVYGAGAENVSLPAFIVMNLRTDGMQFAQAAGWGPAFLPSRFQGAVVSPADGIRNLAMPSGLSVAQRQRQLELIDWFHQRQLEQLGPNSELEARRRSYALADRMQSTAPELMDLSQESAATRKLYGMDEKATADVGTGCLLARRMTERGVRFVQLRVGGWDAHGNIKANHDKLAGATDRPIAGLLTDLKQRGLLESTLVVWCGEFGRTPTMEGRGNGRDHSPAGYSVWLAGGGVAGGKVIGATDPLGYVAIERPVSPQDLHTTILHALGIDAARLSHLHHGRNETPTVFGAAAVTEAFA